MKYFLLILFLVMNANAACLKENQQVTLSGTLKTAIAYGPPGWGEDEEHDEKSAYWVLELDKPIECIDNFKSRSEDWDIKTQLILQDDNNEKKYEKLMNKKVDVTGKIYFANSGFHRTSVLLNEVTEIILIKK